MERDIGGRSVFVLGIYGFRPQSYSSRLWMHHLLPVCYLGRISNHKEGGAKLAARSVSCNPSPVKNYTAVVERDSVTGLLVGFVPGFPGAHSQAATLDELQANLREVVEMLLEDGDPTIEAEFVGTQNISIG